jgi:hypothetical protein
LPPAVRAASFALFLVPSSLLLSSSFTLFLVPSSLLLSSPSAPLSASGRRRRGGRKRRAGGGEIRRSPFYRFLNISHKGPLLKISQNKNQRSILEFFTSFENIHKDHLYWQPAVLK